MSTIAYSGKLSLEKGVHCLLAAMPMVAKRVPGAKLVLMGSGVADAYFKAMLAALEAGDVEEAARNMEAAAIDPWEQEWTAQVRSYWGQQQSAYLDAARCVGLESRVQFAGLLPLKGIAERLPTMDVQVIPSIVKEAFPLVSLEALASGVPPLGPYRGGLAPILDQAAEALGSLGFLLKVDPRPDVYVADLEEKLSALLLELDKTGIRERVSQQCRELAVGSYDWDRVVDRLADVYTEIVSQDGRNAYWGP